MSARENRGCGGSARGVVRRGAAVCKVWSVRGWWARGWGRGIHVVCSAGRMVRERGGVLGLRSSAGEDEGSVGRYGVAGEEVSAGGSREVRERSAGDP